MEPACYSCSCCEVSWMRVSLMPDYQSARWLAIERLNRDYDKPFFLAVGFLRPYVPWYVPQKWFDMHPLGDIETPPYLEEDMEDVPDIALEMDNLPMMPRTQWAMDNNEWRKAVQAYLACVSFVDHYTSITTMVQKNFMTIPKIPMNGMI